MKVILPSRVPMQWVLPCATALAAVQLLEGSSVRMTVGSSAFIVLTALAFNMAGGLRYPSGAYIFFNAMLSAGIGILTKTILGEPLQGNLLAPERTMAAYVVCMASMLAAAAINRSLRRRQPLLADTLAGTRTDQVALGCLLLALIPEYVLPKSVLSTYVQLNHYGILAIMLPVYQKARDTDGRRTFNLVSFGLWAYFTVQFGLLEFSKQGIFAPSAAWAAAALASGYRVGWRKALILTAVFVPALIFLTPFSQLGRNMREDGRRIDVVMDLLSHPVRTRELYQAASIDSLLSGYGYHWYDQPQGILDRLSLLPMDDALIYATEHGHRGSLHVLGGYFLNSIPRYLYPNKPTLTNGNTYAHELGLLADDDVTTGVSFTPIADAYHAARWLGVTVVSGTLFLFMFFVCDSVAGDVTRCRWALLYILWCSHLGAEGLLNATIYAPTTLTVGIVAAQWVSTRFAPLLGSLVTLPQREWLKANRRHSVSAPLQSSRI